VRPASRLANKYGDQEILFFTPVATLGPLNTAVTTTDLIHFWPKSLKGILTEPSKWAYTDLEQQNCGSAFNTGLDDDDDNNNKLQLGCYPLAVVILHIYKI